MKLRAYKQKKDFVSGKTIVGIDPAKQHHQASVINHYGLQIGKSFSFPVKFDDFDRKRKSYILLYLNILLIILSSPLKPLVIYGKLSLIIYTTKAILFCWSKKSVVRPKNWTHC